MKENYKLSYQVIARILLVLFLLESCHNNITPTYLQEKEKIEEISDLCLQKSDLSREEDRQYIAKGGHVVSLYQEGDNLQAMVKENLPEGFTRSHILPVYISEHIRLMEVASLSQIGQKRVIEVLLPKNKQPGHVYIGKRGLLGGMRRKVRGAEKEEKREKAEEKASTGLISNDQHLLIDTVPFKEEATRLGHFRVLPIELLQMILAYVTCPHILNVTKVNHTFYELITGYTKVGLIGVENRPNPVFHSNSWLSEKQINFKRQSPESVPSRLLYCFIGKAINVSESFWPYLQDTKIHTLNLDRNKIGDQGVEALAKALPNTQIQELNLGYNQISPGGAQALAKALPDTKIHTLNLGCNQIGVEGAQELAKALPGTKIQTLYLWDNKIGTAGAEALAKALPNTKIERLNLYNNQIGDQGVEVLATALPSTEVHTLNLSMNQIGDQGVEALAKALPGTKIQTLDLRYNQIGALGAQELANALMDTEIHTLNLGGNEIGDQGVESLSKALPGTKIHTLILDRNKISDQGTGALAGALPDTKIERLDLKYNRIGAESLAKVLSGSNMQTLDLGGNQISRKTQALLQEQFPHIKFEF